MRRWRRAIIYRRWRRGAWEYPDIRFGVFVSGSRFRLSFLAVCRFRSRFRWRYRSRFAAFVCVRETKTRSCPSPERRFAILIPIVGFRLAFGVRALDRGHLQQRKLLARRQNVL